MEIGAASTRRAAYRVAKFQPAIDMLRTDLSRAWEVVDLDCSEWMQTLVVQIKYKILVIDGPWRQMFKNDPQRFDQGTALKEMKTESQGGH